MNKRYRLHILMAFILFISGLAFPGLNISDAAPLEQGATIQVIDESGEDILPMTPVDMSELTYAEDMLKQVTADEDIELQAEEHPEFGMMIKQIGDAEEHEDYYWAFIVNGLAADVGVSSYEVEDGDHILLALTDDFEPSVTVNVSAVAGEEVLIDAVDVTLMAHATSYDALYQAASQADVLLDATVDDEFLVFINNIGDAELGETDYWHIRVNDKDLETGILQHEATDGDELVLEVESFDDDAAVGEDASEDANENVSSAIQGIISYVESADITLTYGKEWWIIGLAQAGETQVTDYVADATKAIESDDGKFDKATDLERVIIALTLSGENATDVSEYDLIDMLATHDDLGNPLINTATFALLAFDSLDYDVSEDVREDLIQVILDNEIVSGGWTFSGDEPSPDLTGMVLAALAPYADNDDVQQAIDRGVSYLSTSLDENGGYDITVNGGYTSEAVSQVIIGLTAVGVDPTSDAFTTDDTNLVDHLMMYQNDDGSFSHLLDEDEANEIATSQALLALTAYDHYLKELGSVYQSDALVNDQADNDSEEESDTKGAYIRLALGIFLLGTVVLIHFFKTRKKK